MHNLFIQYNPNTKRLPDIYDQFNEKVLYIEQNQQILEKLVQAEERLKLNSIIKSQNIAFNESNTPNSTENKGLDILDKIQVYKHSEKKNSEEEQHSKQSIFSTSSVLDKEEPFISEQEGYCHLLRDSIIVLKDREKQPLFKSNIVCIIAFPQNIDLKTFLEVEIIEHRKFMKKVRIIRQTDSKGRFLRSSLLLFYFDEREHSQRFFNKFNSKLMSNQTCEMFILFYINQLLYFPALEIPIENIIKLDNQDQLIEIPNCPICIERIDPSLTGVIFFTNVPTSMYMSQGRWLDQKHNCPACFLIEQQEPQCYKCEQTKNVWICMICGNLGCGRYDSRHAQDHSMKLNHRFSMEYENNRIWDYIGDTFVHRITKNAQELIISFSDVNSVNTTGNQKLYQERIDAAIWEYCYIITHQMDEQRIYFEKKIEQEEESIVQDESIIDQMQSVDALIAQLEQKQQIKADLVRDKENFRQKTKFLNEKSASIQQEVENLKAMHENMNENLKLMNKEENQVVPYQKEIEVEYKNLEKLQLKLQELYECL